MDSYFLCDPEDGHVSRQWLRSGSYNSEEIAQLRNCIRSKDSVLLVGAHIGSLAIVISGFCERLCCVEANKHSFKLLKANVRLSGRANIACHNFAAGHRMGLAKFLHNRENSGGSKLLLREPAADDIYDLPQVLDVPMKALDEFFEKKIDVVIMDIEGGEAGAIQGAQRLLKTARIFVLEFIPRHVESFSGLDMEGFCDLLLDLGFDHVRFPRTGVEGKPADVLLETLKRIQRSKSYEDGIILSRGKGDGV